MATIHHVAIKCLLSSKKRRVCRLDDWSQRRKGGGGVMGRWRGQRRRTNEQNSSTKPWQRGRHVFVMRLSPCLGLTLIGDVSYIQRQTISVWEARKGRNRSCEREGDDLVGEATAAAWVGIKPKKGNLAGQKTSQSPFSLSMHCEGLFRYKPQCVFCSFSNIQWCEVRNLLFPRAFHTCSQSMPTLRDILMMSVTVKSILLVSN